MGPQKDAAEFEFQSALLQFFREQLGRIKEKLERAIPKSRKGAKAKGKAAKDPSAALDSDFWDNETTLLLAIIRELIRRGAVSAVGLSAAALEAELGIGLDWTLANTAAVNWAKEHAGEIVDGITSTTQEQLAASVSSWLDTPGATMGDLFGELESLYAFSESRAQMIAVTEVTQAYAEGGLEMAREAEESGLFTWRKMWHTNRDDLVCPLCAPLDGATTLGADNDDWEGVGPTVPAPPMHPRCRCWITFEPVLNE